MRNPGSWLSLGLVSGTFLAKIGVRRERFVQGTFVRRRGLESDSVFTLFRTRIRNLID